MTHILSDGQLPMDNNHIKNQYDRLPSAATTGCSPVHHALAVDLSICSGSRACFQRRLALALRLS